MYAADRNAPEHVRCRSLLESWRIRNDAWFLTWGICVLRQSWSGAAAREFLLVITAAPGLTLLLPTERHSAGNDACILIS